MHGQLSGLTEQQHVGGAGAVCKEGTGTLRASGCIDCCVLCSVVGGDPRSFAVVHRCMGCRFCACMYQSKKLVTCVLRAGEQRGGSCDVGSVGALFVPVVHLGEP